MNKLKIDWLLTLPALLLGVFSLTIISSVAPQLLQDQITYLVIGVAAYLFISYIDYELFFSLHWVSYFTLLLLSFMTIFFGFISRGAQRWVYIGPFNFQPSEMIKPFLLITFATIASSKIRYKSLLLLLLGILPVLSVYFQPDLGTTLVIFVGWASTVISRMSIKFTMTIAIVIAILSIPLYFFGLHDYQRQRLISFVNPYSDPLGSGYHIIQSTIAVGSGQVIGRGLGHGTQTQLRFLPEHHTDFIFASISEELGLVGAAICIGLYAIMFWRIYSISQSVTDAKGSLYCLASLALIAFQTFVNIGMNIGIAPITGITLPLLSYGGSSILSMAIMLGLVHSISKDSRENRSLIIR